MPPKHIMYFKPAAFVLIIKLQTCFGQCQLCWSDLLIYKPLINSIEYNNSFFFLAVLKSVKFYVFSEMVLHFVQMLNMAFLGRCTRFCPPIPTKPFAKNSLSLVPLSLKPTEAQFRVPSQVPPAVIPRILRELTARNQRKK